MFLAFGGTAILGGLMVALRSIPGRLFNYIVYLCTVQVHIESSDDAFYWMAKWLSNHPSTTKMRKLRLATENDPNRNFNERKHQNAWLFSPGLGKTWFWHNWRLVVIDRQIKEGRGENDKPREFLSLRVLGRDQTGIRELMQLAHKDSILDTSQKIYKVNDYGEWEVAIRKEARSLNTVVLKSGQQERIVSDMEQFLSNKEYYKKRGIPYHRGYLFKGPPGTGKTSNISAIAGHFGMHVAILSLSTMGSDSALLNALGDIPHNCVVAIEDIDCASDASISRKEKPSDKEPVKSKGKSAVTLAGLLNALDGIMTPDGSIFIMTTNYPELLDAALIRPGRIDMQEEFGLMDKEQQERMSALFFETPISVDREISPAQMQGVLMTHPTDPEGAIKALEGL